MSKKQDIADTKQSWYWVGMGWTCLLIAPLMLTFESALLALACGISANAVGAYVGLRRYWR